MKRKGLYSAEHTEKLRHSAKIAVRDSLKAASKEQLPPIDELFNDVYEKVPTHIQEQKDELKAHLRKYPDMYELEKFQDGTDFPNQK